MRTKSTTHRWLVFFALSFSLLAGCGAGTNNGQVERRLPANGNRVDSGQEAAGREVALNDRFKLTPDEKVTVKETPLSVQLKSVRRTWYVDGKSETADADLVVTLNREERRQWVKVGEKVTVGDYTVKVWGADPFGKTSAELMVTRG